MFSSPLAIGSQGPVRSWRNESDYGPGGQHFVGGLPRNDQVSRLGIRPLLRRDDPGRRFGQVDANPEIGQIATGGWFAAQAGATADDHAETVDAFLIHIHQQGAAAATVEREAPPGLTAIAGSPQFHLPHAGRADRIHVVLQLEEPRVDHSRSFARRHGGERRRTARWLVRRLILAADGRIDGNGHGTGRFRG